MTELTEAQLDRIGTLLGARPTSMLQMAGATSSDLYRLETASAAAVLRVFRAERWEASTSELSARELAILNALGSTDLPAPGPLGSLPENGVLMSWLPGQVDLPEHPGPSWLEPLAQTLAHIHRLTISVPYRYESWNDTTSDERPDWWKDPRLWTEAQSGTDRMPRFETCFIHRDYHPVNVLREGERISGIVDWINACMGPAGIDVAHCRLNLALMYGQAAAEAFLEQYEAATPGYRHHPYWDLDDALGALPDVKPYPPWAEFGLSGLTAEIVRARLETFVEAAVGSLSQPDFIASL